MTPDRERKTAHGTEGGTNDSSGVRSFPPFPPDRRRRLIRHLIRPAAAVAMATGPHPHHHHSVSAGFPRGAACTHMHAHTRTHTPIRTAPDLRDYCGCLTVQRVLVSNQRVRTTCRPSSGNLVNQPFRDSDVQSDSVLIKAVGGGEQETLWELMSTPAPLSRVSRAN